VADPRNDDWFNHPWAYSTGSAIVAGLVVAYAGQLEPLWIGLAVVAFLGVGGFVFGLQRVVGFIRDLRSWREVVEERVGWLHDELQWLALRDVINNAQDRGWSLVMYDGGGGIEFTSPDNAVSIRADPTLFQPNELAKRLHAEAPDCFPSDWLPRAAGQAGTSVKHIATLGAKLQRLDGATTELAEHVNEFDANFDRRVARATLADVEADAIRGGWRVEWYSDSVRFIKSHDMATVQFSDINIRKLRDAMRLDVRPG
jgi:hypothetical protein